MKDNLGASASQTGLSSSMEPSVPLSPPLRASIPRKCNCAEIAGENPDCPVHELTLEKIAAWEDWECITNELCGFTARKVAQKALSTLPNTEAEVPGEDVVERIEREIERRGSTPMEAIVAALSAVPEVERLSWQPLETVCNGEIVDWWIEGLDGEGWRITGHREVAIEPLCIVTEDGGTYWPHENGGFATHWRPLPDPPEARAALASSGGGWGVRAALDIYATDRERIRRTDWRRVHVEADRRPPVNLWNRRTKEEVKHG